MSRIQMMLSVRAKFNIDYAMKYLIHRFGIWIRLLSPEAHRTESIPPIPSTMPECGVVMKFG